MPERFAWITPPTSEVIDQQHPDFDHWQETMAWEDHLAGQDPTPPALPQQPKRPEVPAVALALSREAAAEALGVSVDYFDQHVKPNIRVVPGRRVLVPVRELERWLDDQAAFALRGH